MPSFSSTFAASPNSKHPGLPEADLLEAMASALKSVLPCIDREKHELDLGALEQIAARAVSVAELLRAACDATENSLPDASFERGSRSLRELERSHIAETLELCGWVIEGKHGAAQLLGLHPNTLRHRLRKLDLKRPPKSASPPLRGDPQPRR